MKKTILVIGATGAQGGSVARHLLDRDRFAVRAFTGDLADRASIRVALKGVYGVFAHAGMSEPHARNLIHAVAGAEVEHFVWSPEELADYAQSLGVPMTTIEIDDDADAVATIFERPAEFIGRHVRVAADLLAPSEYAAALARATLLAE